MATNASRNMEDRAQNSTTFKDLDIMAEAALKVAYGRNGLDQRHSYFDCAGVDGMSFNRDARRINQVLFENKMLPKIGDWNNVQKEFALHLKRMLHGNISVKFIHVSGTEGYEKIDDNSWTSQFDFVVIHGDELVYLAIPSPDLSARLYRDATKALNIEIEVTDWDRRLIEHHGSKQKRSQYPPSSLNFGVTVRPQNYGLFIQKPKDVTTSISSVVLPLYQEKFAGVYIKKNNKRKRQVPSLPKGNSSALTDIPRRDTSFPGYAAG